MSTHVNHDGQEFEVTEADKALVAPLGWQPGISEETQREMLVGAIKEMIMDHSPEMLPAGFWDAFPDEGEWVYNEDLEQNDPRRTDDIDAICIRGYDPARDDVFVRLPTDAHYESLWDIGIYTRNRTPEGGVGLVAIPQLQEGDEITPEQVVNDLGALLSVFRLFVQQGRL